MTNKKILCVGSVTADVIISPADDLPAPGTLRSVDSITAHPGGCALNAACDLAKLGADVSLSCLVGDDIFGDFAASRAKECGVDVSGVVKGETPTTLSAVCLRSDGERSFLYYPGSAAAFRESDVRDEVFDKSDFIFIAGTMLMPSFDGEGTAKLLARAKSAGKTTFLDTAWDFSDRWMPSVAPAIPYLDYFMPSIGEAEKLTGEKDFRKMASVFRDMGASNVIIKLGAEGAYMLAGDGSEHMSPAFLSVKAVDTTGAGDSFCAGFILSVAAGRDADSALTFANAVGAHCIGKIGASEGIVGESEILAFIRAQGR